MNLSWILDISFSVLTGLYFSIFFPSIFFNKLTLLVLFLPLPSTCFSPDLYYVTQMGINDLWSSYRDGVWTCFYLGFRGCIIELISLIVASGNSNKFEFLKFSFIVLYLDDLYNTRWYLTVYFHLGLVLMDFL